MRDVNAGAHIAIFRLATLKRSKRQRLWVAEQGTYRYITLWYAIVMPKELFIHNILMLQPVDDMRKNEQGKKRRKSIRHIATE